MIACEGELDDSDAVLLTKVRADGPQSCSKELESLLLRMYNDACSEESLPSVPKKGMAKSASPELPDELPSTEEEDNNPASPRLSSSLARELEELIKLEQAHRVALLKQVASEREQVGTATVEFLEVSDGVLTPTLSCECITSNSQ